MRFELSKLGERGRQLLAISGLLFTAALLLPVAAQAKTPGKTYCFNGICHYVKTIAETQKLVGRRSWVNASYYDDAKRDRYNPSNITSSGEYFRSWTPDNAASPVLPNGTKVLVWHPQTKKSVLVRINNSGPYYGNRLLDLSRAAAERLGMSASGVKSVQMAVVSAPTADEARYRKGRTYAPVKGYLGTFASLETAISSLNTGTAVASVKSKPVVVAKLPAQAAKPAAAKPPLVARKAAPQPGEGAKSPKA